MSTLTLRFENVAETEFPAKFTCPVHQSEEVVELAGMVSCETSCGAFRGKSSYHWAKGMVCVEINCGRLTRGTAIAIGPSSEVTTGLSSIKPFNA